jgi:RimJ/RimL family protein N-acetyltransferase
MADIYTPRLYLQYLTLEDVNERYVSWLNDPEVNRYLETRHSKQTLQTCRAFVDDCIRSATSHLFGIFLKADGEHIGNAKIGFVNRLYETAQVSLFIGEKGLWGKGLSKEVIHGITGFGFNKMQLHRLEAGCYEDNLGSLRAFLKVGYSVEGFFRDNVVVDGRRTGCFKLGILRNEFS